MRALQIGEFALYGKLPTTLDTFQLTKGVGDINARDVR